MTELSTVGGISLDTFRQLQATIPDLPTEELTDIFAKLNGIHKVTKDVEEDMKKELRNRQSDGGKDSKGNSYLTGKTGGVKIEARTSFELREDAVYTLDEEDLLDLFPKEPNVESMLALLKHVDPAEYMEPVVTVAAIAELVERGELDPVFAESLLRTKTIYAVKNIDMKELPDDRV